MIVSNRHLAPLKYQLLDEAIMYVNSKGGWGQHMISSYTVWHEGLAPEWVTRLSGVCRCIILSRVGHMTLSLYGPLELP